MPNTVRFGCALVAMGAALPLKAQCPERVANAATMESLVIGVVVAGRLEASNRDPATGSICRQYRLTIHAPTIVQIDLSAPQLDAYLILRTEDDAEEARDDDAGSGLDARLRVHLDSGTYRVIVTSFSMRMTGAFRLLANNVAGPPDDILEPAMSIARFQDITSTRSLVERCTRDNGFVGRYEDPAIPSFFFRVRERYRHRERTVFEHGYGVLSASDTASAPRIEDAEVDRKSTLIVQFDRNYLDSAIRVLPMFGVTIKAEVVSASGGTREVAVPGYTAIGEVRRRAGASLNVRAARELVCGTYSHLSVFLAGTDSVAETVRSDSASLHVVLSQFVRGIDDNRRLFTFLASAMNVSPVMLMQRARSSLAVLEAPITSQSAASFAKFVSELHGYLDGVVSAIDPDTDDRGLDAALRLYVREQFKDVELPIPATGVRPGERIIITVANDALGDTLPRESRVDLTVVEFGATRMVTDALILVNRVGASSRSVDSLEQALVRDTLDISTAAAPYRFSPTPGVSLLWRYYPRTFGSREITQFFRSLGLALGINVSFPRFGTTTLRVTRDPDATPVVSRTDDTEEFQVGVGLTATIFDGAVQFLVGKNLSVDNKPGYYGIGFSFGGIAERLRGSGQ